jgi:outer membrane protein insertion porin family
MVSKKPIQTATTALLILLASGWICPPAFAEGTTDGASPIESGTISKTDLPEGDLTVEDVTVEGNRLVPQEEILNVIQTHRGDRFDRDQVMKDLKAVNGMGYFDDRSLQAVPEMGGSGVLLKIRVQENAPVTQFAFQGNTVLSSEELSTLFSDQLGKPQNLTQLSQSIDKIEQAYHDKGFMLARVTDVKDDPDGSVGIKIDEGQISDVKIVGNKKTKDFIIRNAIKLKAGQVYNERQLTADLRKLYGNGYFNDIRRSLTPDPANPEKYQLKVEVDEKRTGSVGLGGGVDTIAGPFGSFSFSDANFRGRGQILSFTSQLGTGMMNGATNAINNGGANFLPTGVANNTYQFEANWVEPSIRGGKTSMSVGGFARNYASMMVDDSMQRSLGGTLSFSRPIGKHWSGSLALTGEQTFLKGFDNVANSLLNTSSAMQTLENNAMAKGMDSASAAAFAQNIRNQQLKGGLYVNLSPTLYRDTRDQALNPTKGSFTKLTAGPSLGITGSSFFKAGVSRSDYHSLTKETVLATNIQGGAGAGSMPQFGQYRLGGFNGIRGYQQFSALGSGTSLLMGSAELRHRLPLPKGEKGSAGGMILDYIDKNVKGTLFVDGGAVGGNSLINSAYNRTPFAASVGMGLRLNIPMLGLVRLDYGIPLLQSALGKGFIPRFTVGFGDKF